MKNNTIITTEIAQELNKLEQSIHSLNAIYPYVCIEFTGDEKSFLLDGKKEILKDQVSSLLDKTSGEETFEVEKALYNIGEKETFFSSNKDIILQAISYEFVKEV